MAIRAAAHLAPEPACSRRVPTAPGYRTSREATSPGPRVSLMLTSPEPYVTNAWQEHGIPFRGRNWLRQLGAHPRVGLSQGWLQVAGGGPTASSSASGAVVPGGASASAAAPAATAAPGGKLSSPFATSEALLRSTRTTPTDQSAAANAARSAIGHEFVPGSDGPVIHLPTGRTDAQLRQAMQLYDHVRLMHVTMSDADALLRCYEEPGASTSMRHLNNLLFPHEWSALYPVWPVPTLYECSCCMNGPPCTLYGLYPPCTNALAA